MKNSVVNYDDEGLNLTEKIEICDHLNISHSQLKVAKAYGTQKRNAKKKKKMEKNQAINVTFESPSAVAKIFSMDFKNEDSDRFEDSTF